jgi:putative oxidoreductase
MATPAYRTERAAPDPQGRGRGLGWIFEPSPSPWTGRMLAVFRIVTGLIFVSAGTTKMFGFPAGPPDLPPFDPLTQIGFGALLEVVGGLAIVLGLLTRPVAFVLAGEMAVAYFQFHAPASFFPTVNQGIPAILYCFLFLYLTFAGAGPWSLDALIARSRVRADHAQHGQT